MPQIHIPNRRKYDESIRELASWDVIIVSDFDFTITHGDRRFSKSSFGLMETMGGDISGFIEERRIAYKKFQPFEHDPRLIKDERDKYMEEWWRQGLDICRTYGITEEQLASIDYSQAPLRDGWREFLHFCNANTIPVHILSAGIGQTIIKMMHFYSIPTENLSIISNQLLFDTAWVCIGHNPNPPIHTWNKKDHTIHGADKRIILFWDHIDDADMTHDATLRVWFYNPWTSASIEEYLRRFDVVIESAESDAWYLRTLAQNIRS